MTPISMRMITPKTDIDQREIRALNCSGSKRNGKIRVSWVSTLKTTNSFGTIGLTCERPIVDCSGVEPLQYGSS